MKRNKDKYPPLLGFVDLLLNLAVAFAFLFMLSQMLINVNKNKDSAAEREGAYIIEISWDNGMDADVDLWVLGPNNERSGFLSRDNQMMSLLRDDLGNTNDKYVNEKGQEVINPINREEVTIRTPLKGVYVVNIHYFRNPLEGKQIVTVRAQIKRIKENTVISERTITMNQMGEEKTLFYFELNEAKELTHIEQPSRPILWVLNGRGQGNLGP